MRSKLTFSLIAFLTFSTISFSQLYQSKYGIGPKIYGGLILGYNGGFGGQFDLTIGNFQGGVPLSARFGIGYTISEPGIADSARKIFINDATNGTPEESGYGWNLRFDILFPVNILYKSDIYFGARYSMFTANFKYVGGNEFFDITSDQFGLGAGIETQLPLVPNLYLIFSGGADYFFESTLSGHDTAYSPDGENVNPREGYSYENADNAINQPKLIGRFLIGINYGF